MIIFKRTIKKGEFNSTYLNLSDDASKRYGPKLGLNHTEKVIVIDGRGRQTRAQMHHENQLWGSLRQWYELNEIKDGDVITVMFDEDEFKDGLHVIRLIPDIRGDKSESSVIQGEACGERFYLEKEKSLQRIENDPSVIEPDLILVDKESIHSLEIPPLDLLLENANGELFIVRVLEDDDFPTIIGEITAQIGVLLEREGKDTKINGVVITPFIGEFLEAAIRANERLKAIIL